MNTTSRTRLAALLAATAMSLFLVTAVTHFAPHEQPATGALLASATTATYR
jgi:hypothetical protein